MMSEQEGEGASRGSETVDENKNRSPETRTVPEPERDCVAVSGPAGELAQSCLDDIARLKGSVPLRESSGSGWLGRDWLVVGVCVRCGSPIYAPGVWSDYNTGPPVSRYSCGCFLGGVPLKDSPTKQELEEEKRSDVKRFNAEREKAKKDAEGGGEACSSKEE